MPPEQSVLLPVIWLCALRRLTTLPTRSDSCIPAIGKNVKLYQGVTLGALSTRQGQLLANVKRHPTMDTALQENLD